MFKVGDLAYDNQSNSVVKIVDLHSDCSSEVSVITVERDSDIYVLLEQQVEEYVEFWHGEFEGKDK
jgi:hypothetical protein